MKTVGMAGWVAVLVVTAACGQAVRPAGGSASAVVSHVRSNAVSVAAHAPASVPVVPHTPAAPARPAAAVAVAPAVVPAPAAPQAIVSNAAPEAASQTVAQVTVTPAVPPPPFLANATARTPAAITNALVRYGVWARGEKEGEKSFPTERAVVAALNWLQREQQADGSWKGSKEIATPALTALALLTYLGHGETPSSPVYGPTVGKAIAWLQKSQEEGGRFAGRDERDYTQPMAALALAEAYGATLDPEVKADAERAVAVIVKGQHPSGGFSYNLDKATRDDTSYMSWCAQAMAAARLAKLDVPGLGRAIDKTSYAVRQNADPAGGFGESAPGRSAFTSAGLSALLFLGEPRVAEVRNTLALTATNEFNYAAEAAPPMPGASRFYPAWNMTQARFLAGGEAFGSWNKSFAHALVANQNLQRNLMTKWTDVGRWERRPATDPKEVVIQDTCYCTLMLEVYYRYLPLGK
jgi:hypothetical protein